MSLKQSCSAAAAECGGPYSAAEAEPNSLAMSYHVLELVPSVVKCGQNMCSFTLQTHLVERVSTEAQEIEMPYSDNVPRPQAPVPTD